MKRYLWSIAGVAALAGTASAQFGGFQPPKLKLPAPIANPIKALPSLPNRVTVSTSDGQRVTVGRQGNGLGAGYRDGQGNSQSGSVNRDRVQYQQTTRDGQKLGVAVGRNDASYDQRNRDGSRQGGSVQSTGNGNGRVSGYQYDQNGYGQGGTVEKQGNRVQVGGEVRSPGVIPYTQDRKSGNLDINGRNSQATGKYEVYDPTGRVRLGQATGTLNKNGYTQTQQAGIGGVGGQTTTDVRFKGANSRVSYSQGAKLGQVAGAEMGGSVNRQGAKGSAGAQIGGVRVGANANVSDKGVRLSTVSNAKVTMPSYTPPKFKALPVSTPRVDLPKLPPVSVPKVNLPPVNLPKVNVPVSVPKFKRPF